MTGVVTWFTGLPASGKSMLARRVRERCLEERRCCVLLDGDEVRPLLAPGAGFDDEGRDAFYGALAMVAGLVARQGLVVLVAATAHRRAWRDRVRALAPRFLEVYVATPLATCEARDRSGLYARARHGGAPHVPGVGVAFEPPERPDVVASGGADDAAVERIMAALAESSAATGPGSRPPTRPG